MIKTLQVKGMSCGNCEAAVKEALNELNGVEKVEIDLEIGKVNVTLKNGAVTREDLEKTIEDQGYDVVN